MKKNEKSRRGGRKVAVGIAAMLAFSIAAGTVTTQAGNDIVREWNFFTSCFDLMINNTPQQVRKCDPKVRNIVSNNPSLSTPVGGGAGPLLPVSSVSSGAPPTTTSGGS